MRGVTGISHFIETLTKELANVIADKELVRLSVDANR